MTLNLKTFLTHKFFPKGAEFEPLYHEFRGIIERNNQIFDLMADMGDKLGGEYVFDRKYISDCADSFEKLIHDQITAYCVLSGRKNQTLFRTFDKVRQAIRMEIQGQYRLPDGDAVIPLGSLGENAIELAGNKMSVLAHLRNRLLLPVPDGFVITSGGFVEFMQKNKLLKQAAAMAPDREDDGHFREAAAELQDRILNGSIPRKLSREILTQFDRLADRLQQNNLRVSLRSSAWEEDGRASFAGQYSTILNVSRKELLDGYRQIIASAYKPEAWRYRLEKGYLEHEVQMAVGCQSMVNGAISGVLHTLAPNIHQDSMVINASWGLCELVVQGNHLVDTYIVSRISPFALRQSEIVSKEIRLVPGKEGNVVEETIPAEIADIACLNPAMLTKLAQTALRIEHYYKRPQEIEWTVDSSGNLQILQVRQLQFRGRRLPPEGEFEDSLRQARTIFGGRGFAAQCGIGVGRVFKIEENDKLEDIPQNAILVSRFSSPRYGSVMHKLQGIITDAGSPTGHMAALAREYRIPTVVNTGIATSMLKQGQEITLDATQRVVYEDALYALSHFELIEEEVFEDSYEYRLLTRIGRLINQLHLTHAKDESFTPAACRTYHDIAQFIRVKAVDLFIRISEESKFKNMSIARRLASEIPLGLLVVDAGDGTDCPQVSDRIEPVQIKSLPLKALLEGLIELEMWATTPVSVNLKSFMSSFTRTFCASLASPEEIGRNLAVVMKNYMDINLRLGYHFTVMDAYLSETAEDNYINFRFFGGVTDLARRSRRALFIARVLEYFDFVVEIRGDLVTARLKKLALRRMQKRMRMLGGLIGYTRQLDASMNSDQDITCHVENFIKAIKSTIGGDNERRNSS